MIGLEKLTNNFDDIAERLRLRGVEKEYLSKIRDKFIERKKSIRLINELRSKRNELGLEKVKENSQAIDLKKEIKNEELLLESILKELQVLCEKLPNIPALNTPKNEDGNRLVDSKIYNKEIKNSLTYEEILNKLEIIDQSRSSKLSGSKFVVYEGLGVKLLHSLINFMLAENQKRGYKLISAPYLVNLKNLYNTGQLPKFSDDIFKIENYDFGLIPTSEVTLVNLYNNEIINQENLPIKVCSYSPCFRSEVGSAGQENKGLIRLHQFNKVELVNIVNPEESYKYLEDLVSDARNILNKLEISHRVIELCYEELGVSSAKTYDIEIWLPNSKKWLEISSCSNCEDFQSNRANIRSKNNGKKIVLHTLNGSSLAIDRLILAIVEYYYNENENKLEIPYQLEKYMNIFNL
ncbi:MAG: Serine--tRNA ligase [Mycoplasmataceae bacterium]|nr:MAG: Serine--tRNA ligase [Mycoplasmataceae bacterium]